MPTYRDRVTIQYDASADGVMTPDWQTFAANIPANVVSVSGMETYRGRQIESHIKFVVEARYRPDITSEMQVLVESGPFDGRTVHIESVVVVQKRRPLRPSQLLLNCTE